MAKVALRFGCAKQSKNLKRYLMAIYLSAYVRGGGGAARSYNPLPLI